MRDPRYETKPLVLHECLLFQRRLLAWYQASRRKLPWRSKPSLYKTVVSEFMLQQTQVDTVLPYFQRWMKAFPDFKALSAASSKDVLKHWEGLGYYSRARHLHRLAKILAGLKQIPKEPEAWLQFPGVGPYTAAAITSISFGAKAAVVDGNVIRLISRLCAEPALFKDSSQAAKRLKPIAEALLDRKHPGDYNQALMELGAVICIRSKPRCLICPVRPFCAAFAQGNPDSFPRFEKKKTEQVRIDRLWVLHKNALLLQRASKEARRLSEIYELPLRHLLERDEQSMFLTAVKRRAIGNQRIEERIFALIPSSAQLKRLAFEKNVDWIALNRLDDVVLSGPHRRWIKELLGKE